MSETSTEQTGIADLDAAIEDWKLSEAGFSDQRTKEEADLDFESGNHWTEAELAWKKQKNAPAFVMDQTSGQVAKITNQPVHRGIVKAGGGGADPKSAANWQGVCRRVENLSGAEDIYKYARRHAVIMGRGFWRVRADYFNQVELRADGQYDFPKQDIRIEGILDQHAVYPDPRCKQLDFSDMRFCIIAEDMRWDDFKRTYGTKATKHELAHFQRGFGQGGTQYPPEWATEKTIRVAERYYIEDQPLTLCVLKPGTPLQDGSLAAGPTVIVKDAKAPAYPTEAILREHTFDIPKVKWMKFTAADVLERADVPGRYIPVVMIVGERRRLQGKTDYRGVVRMAKWPQRMVDFMESRLASVVDLAAYDTWMGANESVGDFADDYTNAHLDRPGLLRWNHKDAANDPLPEPKHITVSADVSGIVLSAQRASMGLRHVLGVPDVTPDESRPEQSGKAIGLRQQEQAQTTSHYGDSTKAGIRHTMRIIMSMGREVYDVAQILRIVGAGEKEIELAVYKGDGQQAAAAQMLPPPSSPDQAEQMRHMLDISLGDYDVDVVAGKGYQNGREETVDIIERVLPMMPPPMQMKAVPIMVKNLDAPGMQELAEAIKPPDQNSNMIPVEEAQKAQMVIDQMAKAIQHLEQERDQKTAELTNQKDIAQIKATTDLKIEQMKLAAAYDLKKLELEADPRKAEMGAKATVGAAAASRPDVAPAPQTGAQP